MQLLLRVVTKRGRRCNPGLSKFSILKQKSSFLRLEMHDICHSWVVRAGGKWIVCCFVCSKEINNSRVAAAADAASRKLAIIGRDGRLGRAKLPIDHARTRNRPNSTMNKKWAFLIRRCPKRFSALKRQTLMMMTPQQKVEIVWGPAISSFPWCATIKSSKIIANLFFFRVHPSELIQRSRESQEQLQTLVEWLKVAAPAIQWWMPDALWLSCHWFRVYLMSHHPSLHYKCNPNFWLWARTTQSYCAMTSMNRCSKGSFLNLLFSENISNYMH